MKSVSIFITTCTLMLSSPTVGQTELSASDRIDLANRIDDLIYGIQDHRPDQTTLASDRREFLKAFSEENIRIPNFLFPDFLDAQNSSFCQQVRSAFDQFTEAARYIKDNQGIYEHFYSDIGMALSHDRLNTDEGRTHVELDILTKYPGKDTLFAQIKSKFTIGFSAPQPSASKVWIENVELIDQLIYKKRYMISPEFRISIFVNRAPFQFDIFESQLFSSPSTSRQLGTSVEGLFRLFRSWHLGLGLGYFQYSLAYDSYTTSFISIDDDNDSFIRTISGSGLTEDFETLYLVVPLEYRYTLPKYKSLTASIQLGISAAYAFHIKASGSGTFDYQGFYPQFNFSPETNIERLGIFYDQEISDNEVTYEGIPSVFGNLGFDIYKPLNALNPATSGKVGVGFFTQIPLTALIQKNPNQPLSAQPGSFAGSNNYSNSDFISPIGFRLIYQPPNVRKVTLKKACPN